MGYQKQPVSLGQSQCDVSFFVIRVFHIQKHDEQWILKNGTGFLKTDPMFFEIDFRFEWIPFHDFFHYSTISSARKSFFAVTELEQARWRLTSPLIGKVYRVRPV
jgi:hypothetical protein